MVWVNGKSKDAFSQKLYQFFMAADASGDGRLSYDELLGGNFQLSAAVYLVFLKNTGLVSLFFYDPYLRAFWGIVFYLQGFAS